MVLFSLNGFKFGLSGDKNNYKNQPNVLLNPNRNVE